MPDAKTVWLYREALAKTGLTEALFADFDTHLKENGYLAMGGQIIDATIVPIPKNRNSRDEAIKAGEMPKGWESQPAKRRQKDRDARWTKKHGRSYYGYKNHIGIDRRHKFVRRYTVTNAARHDSQEFDAVLDEGNTLPRRVGRQRVPVSRDRGKTGGSAFPESCAPTGEAKPWPFRTRTERQ